MNRQQIRRFANCNIANHENHVSQRGFDKTMKEEDIIRIAIENWCPIIVKNGKNGRWYLRGRGKTTEFLQSQLEQNAGNHRDGVYCLWLSDELLEFGVGIDNVCQLR
jgi:hypothetical protein